MAASAPFIKECTECHEPIDDYTNHFIQGLEDKFGHINICQEFLTRYKINPDIVDKCMDCLLRKWIKIRFENINSNNVNRKQQAQIKTSKNNSKFTSILTSRLCYWALLIGVVLLGYYFAFLFDNTENRSMISDDKLRSTITKLKVQFPSLQRGLLRKMNSAFLRLKSPGEPFVLLLLYDDTNKKTTDCLASYTSIVAKQNIFTDTAKSLWMNASEWSQYSDQDDQELLHEKLITPLKENEVLILENLQDLPWSLANSLHYLCDSENPQIVKAMYILELKVNEDSLIQLTDGDKIKAAERAMNIAWMNAPNSFRAALISRLTSYVDAVLLISDEECSNDEWHQLQSEKSFIRILP